MKYVISLLISVSAFAETYEVSHRGHVYTFAENENVLTLKSKRLNFEIPVKPCSKALAADIKVRFEGSLNFTTASKDNVVIVKSKKSVNIPEGHANGKFLTFFPDHFAKSYLIYKELCK